MASPKGRDGSVTIHTDALMYAGRFDEGVTAKLPIAEGRHAWVQIARGQARVNGQDLKAGDGAALSGIPAVQITGIDASEILVFDLA